MVGRRYATTALLDLAQSASDARWPIQLCAVLALRQMQQELGRGLMVINAKPHRACDQTAGISSMMQEETKGDEHGRHGRSRLGRQTREHAPILATACRVLVTANVGIDAACRRATNASLRQSRLPAATGKCDGLPKHSVWQPVGRRYWGSSLKMSPSPKEAIAKRQGKTRD